MVRLSESSVNNNVDVNNNVSVGNNVGVNNNVSLSIRVEKNNNSVYQVIKLMV